MPSYFLAFITALIAVYALTPLVIKFAVKTGAMDKPKSVLITSLLQED